MSMAINMHLMLFLLSSVGAAIVKDNFYGEFRSEMEFVNHLNSIQNSFHAKESGMGREEMISKAMSAEFMESMPELSGPPEGADVGDDSGIPESFDSRSRWPKCTSLKEIRDQANCGSCWAFGAAEVMTDRICISTNGSTTPTISEADILACCQNCGNGCNGGYPSKAIDWWTSSGVVTGGEYASEYGCYDYQFAPCGAENSCRGTPPTPSCEKKCRSGYARSYKDDKHFGKNTYQVGSGLKVAEIQKEVMMNGPVVTCFNLYQDFYQYSKGIYKHVSGAYLGGHCVKIIGWGTENGTDFWIVANSWGYNWGEGGFFRIVRGVNDSNFERWIYAGQPKIDN